MQIFKEFDTEIRSNNEQGNSSETKAVNYESGQELLSSDDAYRIASDYWQVESGDVDEETGFTLSIVVYDETTEFNGRDCYAVDLKWLVDNHYSRIDLYLHRCADR